MEISQNDNKVDVGYRCRCKLYLSDYWDVEHGWMLWVWILIR